MAQATDQDVRDFLGDTGQLSAARVSFMLRSAGNYVLGDGVPEEHESFRDLQVLRTCHLLEVSGAISGQVSSRSVGDVSISFASGGNDSSYMKLYSELKTQIFGLTGRIA